MKSTLNPKNVLQNRTDRRLERLEDTLSKLWGGNPRTEFYYVQNEETGQKERRSRTLPASITLPMNGLDLRDAQEFFADYWNVELSVSMDDRVGNWFRFTAK